MDNDGETLEANRALAQFRETGDVWQAADATAPVRVTSLARHPKSESSKVMSRRRWSLQQDVEATEHVRARLKAKLLTEMQGPRLERLHSA